MSNLPIDLSLPQLLATMQLHANAVLSAPPGAGKTTRVPLALLKIIPPEAGRIIMLEPRRIAAASAARYMAQSLGERVGQTVGYTIRFEQKISTKTRIEVVTEGVLTRRLQDDPELKKVACVIFDEFHERSIHADLGLALCLESQAVLRPDLKLLVMSATLDCDPIARLLGNAPVITSTGRAFPVQVRYVGSSERATLPRRMAVAIKAALSEEEGDLLAFLPGAGEIRAAQRELEGLNAVVICPLYGDLPFEQQQRAILPGPERRVVLATNIAETSLTIDGVRIVVDCGLSRRLQLNPATGLERLVTVRASQASALQRTGRAGRTSPGVCYRLYEPQSFQAMTPFTPPEIQTADLSPLLLELAAWGSSSDSLAWLDSPPETHLAAAKELLQMLGALDKGGAITSLGRRMVRLPLHPRIARMLCAGEDLGLLAIACKIAAELSNRSSAKTAIEQTEKQLLQLMKVEGKSPAALHDDAMLAPLFIVAWPDRIAQQRSGGEGRYLLASGRGAVCRTVQSELLVALQVDGGEGAEGLIHQAATVTIEQIRKFVPQLITRQRVVVWDETGNRISVTEQERLGAVVLASRQVVAEDAEALPLLMEQVIRRGLDTLGWSEAARQLQGRLRLTHDLLPEDQWPDLSDAWLVEHLEDWLAPRLSGLRSQQELERLVMFDVLQELVGWKLLQLLNTVAPVEMAVPSGRHSRLDYSGDEGPVLSVKLQELFGLSESPMVCRGRRAVLVHLLSPAGRPVAVTRDLKGFWERGYPEVRKELRGRYPKHPWPEDPWNAPATHRTKKALERT
jgi:ATP-dependent helicase HrpB